MKIYLIRHGKTQGNMEKRYIGTTDEHLCDSGIDELEEKIAENHYPKEIERLAVSPMLRCRESAQLIFPAVEQEVVTDFRETDFGKFENKNYMELSGDTDYQRWLESNGTLPFPGGESREAFRHRSVSAFDEVLRRWRTESVETAAIVTHGGTIMAILASLIPSDFYDWQVGNGEGYCLSINNGKVSAENYKTG